MLYIDFEEVGRIHIIGKNDAFVFIDFLDTKESARVEFAISREKVYQLGEELKEVLKEWDKDEK